MRRLPAFLAIATASIAPGYAQPAPVALTDYPAQSLFAPLEWASPESQARTLDDLATLSETLNFDVPADARIAQFAEISIDQGTSAQFIFGDYFLPGDAVLLVIGDDLGEGQILRQSDLEASEGQTAFFDVEDGGSLRVVVVTGAGSREANVDPLTVRVTSQAPQLQRDQQVPNPIEGMSLDDPTERLPFGDTLETQCGSTDDRVASSDPRVGRIMPAGCTGWLIADDVALTAGHCDGPGMSILEFNVPVSSPDGRTRPAAIEDQYTIVAASVVSQYLGLGQDWAVFRVAPNSNTGLLPGARQGGFFRYDSTPATQVSVIGFGVDNDPRGENGTRNAENQTQQQHSGAVVYLTHPLIQYSVDTEGGNSGSPIVASEDATLSIGIHTNGGCTTDGGSNSGTTFGNEQLRAAIAEILAGE